MQNKYYEDTNQVIYNEFCTRYLLHGLVKPIHPDKYSPDDDMFSHNGPCMARRVYSNNLTADPTTPAVISDH